MWKTVISVITNVSFEVSSTVVKVFWYYSTLEAASEACIGKATNICKSIKFLIFAPLGMLFRKMTILLPLLLLSLFVSWSEKLIPQQVHFLYIYQREMVYDGFCLTFRSNLGQFCSVQSWYTPIESPGLSSEFSDWSFIVWSEWWSWSICNNSFRAISVLPVLRAFLDSFQFRLRRSFVN